MLAIFSDCRGVMPKSEDKHKKLRTIETFYKA